MLRLRDLKFGAIGDMVPSSGAWSKTLGLSIFDEAKTDTNEMSASAIINTDVVDYQGEVILASGVDLQNYTNNPAVLFEHGKCPAVPFPVGKSMDPSGNLMIARSDYEIEGTSYFTDRYPESVQIFGLVDEGVIRATSIQVMPVEKSLYSDGEGNRYEVTEKSHMIEWSWCRLGVNPEAVRKSFSDFPESLVRAAQLQWDHAARILRKGSVGNERLLAPIRKSLEEMIPRRRSLSPGIDFGDSGMSKKYLTDLELSRMSRGQVMLAMKRIDNYDNRTQPKIKSLYEEIMGKKKEEGEGGGEGGAPGAPGASGAEGPEKKAAGVVPLGADITSQFHGGLGEMAEYFESLSGPLEREEVKAMVGESIGALRGLQAAFESMHGELYPEMPRLGKKKEEMPQEKAGKRFSENLKSWVAGSQVARHQVLGMAGQVKAVASMPGMPKSAVASLNSIAASLQNLEMQAKSFDPEKTFCEVTKADLEEVKKSMEQWKARAIKATQELAKDRLPASDTPEL